MVALRQNYNVMSIDTDRYLNEGVFGVGVYSDIRASLDIGHVDDATILTLLSTLSESR